MDVGLDLYDQGAMHYCFLALISFMVPFTSYIYREVFGLERKSGTGKFSERFLVPLG